MWRKSLVWFLKRSLNEVSAIPKYFLSGLLDADTTALYTMFAVIYMLYYCFCRITFEWNYCDKFIRALYNPNALIPRTYPSKIWITYTEVLEISNNNFSLRTTSKIVLDHRLFGFSQKKKHKHYVFFLSYTRIISFFQVFVTKFRFQQNSVT